MFQNITILERETRVCAIPSNAEEELDCPDENKQLAGYFIFRLPHISKEVNRLMDFNLNGQLF